MTKRITHDDITVSRIDHSGAWECMALVDGYLERRVYFDYTKRQAQQAFYNEINGK